MPQPLSTFPQARTIDWYDDAAIRVPDGPQLIASIFAVSAVIDHEIGLLLVHVLGAHEIPALAMYSILESQSLQKRALNAAAKAKLDADTFKIFSAVLSVTESAQAERHRLAHWIWAVCPQVPEAFLLLDPKRVRGSMIAAEQMWHSDARNEKVLERAKFNFSDALVYRKDDLERALRDLREAWSVLIYFRFYHKPPPPTLVGAPRTRVEAHRQLFNSRLFREALARIDEAERSSQPSQSGSPRQPQT